MNGNDLLSEVFTIQGQVDFETVFRDGNLVDF